ncbi:MAG TPA: hypothetical protein VMR79_04510, partial [Verrucomicrobiae bacterium]|nr:hypothetical protein [Verrucomicrobiae bacterium]
GMRLVTTIILRSLARPGVDANRRALPPAGGARRARARHDPAERRRAPLAGLDLESVRGDIYLPARETVRRTIAWLVARGFVSERRQRVLRLDPSLRNPAAV